MPTCSYMCSELIFRCYCERPRTNVIHLKKLEILPTLVGTWKAPPLHRLSQQRQLLPEHSWMSLAVAALRSARYAVAHAAAATAQAFHARTTADAREDTAAVVLSSASRWLSKTMKGSQVSMMNKLSWVMCTQFTCFIVMLPCVFHSTLKY